MISSIPQIDNKDKDAMADCSVILGEMLKMKELCENPIKEAAMVLLEMKKEKERKEVEKEEKKVAKREEEKKMEAMEVQRKGVPTKSKDKNCLCSVF